MLHEAAAKNIAVLGIQEMRRPGRTVSTAAAYRVFYSGSVQGGQQGVALAVKKSICKLLSRPLLLYFQMTVSMGVGDASLNMKIVYTQQMELY